MDQTLKVKMQTLGVLLAESPLADEIKDVLVGAVEQMSERDIDALILSLQRERAELVDLGNQIKGQEFAVERNSTSGTSDEDEIVESKINEFLASVIKDSIQQNS